MNRLFIKYIQYSLLFLDLIMMFIAYIVILFISHQTDKQYELRNLFIYDVLVWLICIVVTQLYAEKSILQLEYLLKRTFLALFGWTFFIILTPIYNQTFIISVTDDLCFVLLFCFGLFVNRFIYLRVKNVLHSKPYLKNHVLIIGYNDTALKLTDYFEDDFFQPNIVGFVANPSQIEEITRYPIYPYHQDLIDFSLKMKVSEIYSTIMPSNDPDIIDIKKNAEKNCIRFKFVPSLSDLISQPARVKIIRDVAILSDVHEPLEDAGNKLLKRLFDLLISFSMIIFILSWMIPLFGIIIKIESRGPIFFRQRRSGKNNATFNCLKFRTMKINHDADQKQATQNDSRVTRFGRFLRKSSLDEFPQFINVFNGEMSIVGPRPHMIKHTSDYSALVEKYMTRLYLKPGITGWAQINGHRGEINHPQQIMSRVNSDLWYLENWSIWLDIKILYVTFYKMITGDQHAY